MLIGYGVLSMALSARFKMPISIVWSTPGAAFLGASASLAIGIERAVGAFLVAGLLLTITGFWPALGRLVSKIPRGVASGMLAGVIFPFVIATASASLAFPVIVLPMVVLWFILYRLKPVWASPATIVLGFVLMAWQLPQDWAAGLELFPKFELINPSFDWLMMLSVGVPLYLITMASQNVPGFAIMRSLGYEPPVPAILKSTGITSLLLAPLGGYSLNLAAITAALNANEHAAKDPKRRWLAAFTSGVGYLIFALIAAPFAAFVLALPRDLILAVVGLALLATVVSALTVALEQPDQRFAALATFVITASGVAPFGIGAAFWALLAGVAIWLLLREQPSSSK